MVTADHAVRWATVAAVVAVAADAAMRHATSWTPVQRLAAVLGGMAATVGVLWEILHH